MALALCAPFCCVWLVSPPCSAPPPCSVPKPSVNARSTPCSNTHSNTAGARRLVPLLPGRGLLAGSDHRRRRERVGPERAGALPRHVPTGLPTGLPRYPDPYPGGLFAHLRARVGDKRERDRERGKELSARVPHSTPQRTNLCPTVSVSVSVTVSAPPLSAHIRPVRRTAGCPSSRAPAAPSSRHSSGSPLGSSGRPPGPGGRRARTRDGYATRNLSSSLSHSVCCFVGVSWAG